MARIKPIKSLAHKNSMLDVNIIIILQKVFTCCEVFYTLLNNHLWILCGTKLALYFKANIVIIMVM